MKPMFWIKNNLRLFLIGVFSFILLCFFLIKNAWISEDAFISFRVVDNFTHGYGLRWNTEERVQVFTHPLWVLLLSALQLCTLELVYTTIIFSFVITLALYLILWKAYGKDIYTWIIILLSTISSVSFLQYSSSGLENPLSNLLILLFALILFRKKTSQETGLKTMRGSSGIFTLSLLSSLLYLSRPDLAIILIPVWLYLAYRNIKNMTFWKKTFLGMIPFLSWSSFSLFYYGFIFPNTKYAKLNTGIPFKFRIDQGFEYLKYIITYETVLSLTIIVALCFGIYSAYILYKNRNVTSVQTTNNYIPLLSLGIFGYILYLINIGGDYMTGRFFTPLLILSLCIIAEFLRTLEPRLKKVILVAMLLVLMLQVVLNRSKPVLYSGIVDVFYFTKESSTIVGAWPKKIPTKPFSWMDDGEEIRKKTLTSNFNEVFIRGNIGVVGFYAGPRASILDPFALGDAFLARLPTQSIYDWRPGHFIRQIPVGYITCKETKNCDTMDKDLFTYYQAINLIISGELTSFERIKTIIKFNLGYYDVARDTYIKTTFERRDFPLSRLANEYNEELGLPSWPQVIARPENLMLHLNDVYSFITPEVIYPSKMHTYLCHLCSHRVLFYKGTQIVWQLDITDAQTTVHPADQFKQIIQLPDHLTLEGFDKITVQSLKKSKSYATDYLLHIIFR